MENVRAGAFLFQTSMSVHPRLVKMEQHVPMLSTPTPVDVWQDTLGRTVKQVR